MTTGDHLLKGAAQKRRLPRLTGLGVMLGDPGRRRVVLLVAAAIMGLAAAGAGLLRPAPRTLDALPPGAVALVNGEPILMSDFVKELETTQSTPFDQTTPAQRAARLHAMIDQELLVQRGLALDLPEQVTEVRTSLSDAVNALVNAPLLATPPSDADLAAYFVAHQANYAAAGEMTLTDLVLHVGGYENADQTVDQATADAAQAAYDLRSGSSIDYVKQHFGFVDSGRANGTQFDFAAKIHLGPKLYAIASGMTDGQVSEPVVDTDGVHLLIMQSRHPPQPATFEAARSQVYADFIAAREADAQRANLRFLRRNSRILVSPGFQE